MIRAAGGFFTIRSAVGKNYNCRARGVLKRGNSLIMVGDRVLFSPGSEGASVSDSDGVIEKLLPRLNRLYRPSVANVDRLIVVMALKEPECDWQLVSRMLVLAERENLSIYICLNKVDLVEPTVLRYTRESITPYPYQVLLTSTKNGWGLENLAKILAQGCSVVAGPSGVGKSSLLNSIQPGLSLETGQVSNRIGRGRHTTRQAELILLDSGGSVVDTPGFTRLDFAGLKSEELPVYFPEFNEVHTRCAFSDCKHISEPECAVVEEVGGLINPMRYEHYRFFMEELARQGGF